jgi:hypothetical protein
MKSSPLPAAAFEVLEGDEVGQSASFTEGTPQGVRKTSFNLDKELFKQFAVYARLQDMTMTELVQKAIREYMERHNEPYYPTPAFTPSGTIKRSPVNGLKDAIANARPQPHADRSAPSAGSYGDEETTGIARRKR